MKSDDEQKKPPARKVPNPSLLSDPFQDEKDGEESQQRHQSPSDRAAVKKRSSSSRSGGHGQVGLPRSQSVANMSYRRRNTTSNIPDTKDQRPSISSRDAYMQGLLQQMQSLERSLAFSPSASPSPSRNSITLLSDNAKAHVSSSWDRSLVMPGLHRYHPMDDFMVYLLRRNQIHASNVRLIRDNAMTHGRSSLFTSEIPLSPTKTTGRWEDDSSSSLDVGGIAECLRQRWGKTSDHNTMSASIATTASLTSSEAAVTNNTSNTSSNTFQEESFASLDISKQLLDPMKEESPNSVLDVDVAAEPIKKDRKSRGGAGTGKRGEKSRVRLPSSVMDHCYFTLDD
ncbi:hypothetical protein IV203_012919 [Nitzschia inconspicua]|uniref:Uncharacterized protein n=1 Tax=Nitzschia inconspicua TaxID=303405 RepID=A0A9K3M4Q7_9STRA|nr:hypothetical protein IV203_012919 [Nitzschia inconspicua]